MPTKLEENMMAIWLKSMRIAFEVTTLDYNKSIEIRLIDYKHNCLIAVKTYPWSLVQVSRETMKRLVKKFEQEEVYPILFDDVQSRVETVSKPTFRLIREN